MFGTTQNIKNFTPKQIMDILNKGGFRVVDDDEEIDIEFRYYGYMDLGVPDLKGIVEELDNSGREVVCILQDYIERLRPPNMQADRRVQLNDCSNQLHDLAVELDIPIITGSQFNREGVAAIEDARMADKHDIGKKVGTKDISESFGMLKNFDVNISIVIEYDSQERRFWLSFRRLKFRGDDTNRIDYFLQPFVGENSKIQLMEDIDGAPVYRRSMVEEMEGNLIDEANTVQKRTRRTGNFLEPVTDDVDDIAIDDFLEQTAFDMANSTGGDRPDGTIRDADGFCVLIPAAPTLAKILSRKNKKKVIAIG